MKLLLDTHIFHCYIAGDSIFRSDTIALIQDRLASVCISHASHREVIIKNQVGKLPFPEPVIDKFCNYAEQHEIKVLPPR
jgi:PIN domain nuclease of toxin-antitoxin system